LRQQLKSEKLLGELEEVAGRLFSEIRYEQGLFQTGVCSLHGKKILVVNKRQPIDERIAAVAGEIAREGTENLYIKPALRAEINRYGKVEMEESLY
jgi:hypothetical protein